MTEHLAILLISLSIIIQLIAIIRDVYKYNSVEYNSDEFNIKKHILLTLLSISLGIIAITIL